MSYYGGGVPSWQKFYGTPQELIPQAKNVLGIMDTPTTLPGAVTTKVPGAVTPQTPTEYTPALGGKPSVPDPLKAIEDAINAYTSKLGAMQELANRQTAANQAAALKQITDLYPQFTSNTAQLGADIADWSKGMISQPTVNAITQAMAERGVGRGMSVVSPNVNAALARVIGQTSEGLQKAALTGQNTLLSGLPRTTPVSVSSLGLTPGEIFSNLYGAQTAANLYAAAPNPQAAYEQALQNALKGLQFGGAAGRGPYAGAVGGEGTADPNTMAMLQALINRGVGGGMQTPTSAYYTPQVPTATGTPQVPFTELGIPGVTNEGDFWDWMNTAPTTETATGADYGGSFDVVQPGMNVAAPPTNEQIDDWLYNFYFGE